MVDVFSKKSAFKTYGSKKNSSAASFDENFPFIETYAKNNDASVGVLTCRNLNIGQNIVNSSVDQKRKNKSTDDIKKSKTRHLSPQQDMAR